MLRLNSLLWLALAWPASAAAQTPEISRILERLDNIERQNARLAQENRDLASQLHQLQTELAAVKPGAPTALSAATAPATPLAATVPDTPAAAPPATIEERLAIQESRIEEQAQTKVEASQKFPIKITGMALFNAYLNSRYNGGVEYPTAASFTPGTQTGGGTLRQSIIGLEFHGPQTFLGGTVGGLTGHGFLHRRGQLQLYVSPAHGLDRSGLEKHQADGGNR